MYGIGSSNLRNVAVASVLALATLGCGDSKKGSKSPKNGQGSEMTGENGEGGGEGLPPLEEVEPADEDIEVPPAP